MAAEQRSTTYLQPSFTIPRPDRDVTFILPSQEATSKVPDGVTRIVIPPGSQWTPSPHWHELYDENFRVVAGHVRLTVDGRTSIVGPKDGVQRIAKYDVHDFMRADATSSEYSGKDQAQEEWMSKDVIVEEWTSPVDGMKEIFFRNLFSVIHDSSRVYGWKTELQLMMVQSHCDNYPVIVSDSRIWQPLTHVLFFFAVLLGGWLGLKPWYDEYTPPRLRGVATSRHGAVGKDELKKSK
ncbi:hypothetical protein FH972_025844 [Carpinus fangiana]|uniref:Uncharacterized protein n=1 Tax=Carpinus fangiana TaxID=176857 RepID=A0A5N6L2G6_9ROSI|nr:hypothetical protein FH972_025844 [Carpinus fangiana]